MAVKGEVQAFLEGMVRKRGFVHEFHRLLAEHDLEFLKAYEQLLDVAYLHERRLPRITKELIFVGVLTALGASRDHLRAHMAAAASEGASAADILEVLEMVLPPAGVARFVEAIQVWHEAFDT